MQLPVEPASPRLPPSLVFSLHEKNAFFSSSFPCLPHSITTLPPHAQDFSSVAEKTGTYTAMDYADIMEHLCKRWDVANRTGLSGDAAAAQEYVMKLPNRIRKLAEKAQGELFHQDPAETRAGVRE